MLGCRKLNTKSPFHGSNSVRQILMQSSWPLWQTKKSLFEKEGLANSTCKTTASSIQWWNSNSQSLARESPPITTRSMATILMPTTNLYEKDDPIFVPIPVTIYDAFSYAKKVEFYLSELIVSQYWCIHLSLNLQYTWVYIHAVPMILYIGLNLYETFELIHINVSSYKIWLNVHDTLGWYVPIHLHVVDTYSTYKSLCTNTFTCSRYLRYIWVSMYQYIYM